MKKFLLYFFLFDLLLLTLTGLLLRNDYEHIMENRDAFAGTLRGRVDELVLTQAPRSVRLFLFTNAPGLFPVKLVCSHTLPDGKKESLLPGDVAGDGNAEYRIYCPGGFEANLKPGGELRLTSREGRPALQLMQGQVEVRFQKQAPDLVSPLFSLELSGQPEGNRVALALSADGFSLGCLNGVVKGNLGITAAGAQRKNSVVIRDCLLGLKINSSPEKNFMPGDLMDFADAEKNRKDWLPQDLPTHLSGLGIDPVANPALLARIDAVPNTADTIRFSWTSPAAAGLSNCTLYTQETMRAPAQVAHRFQAQASAGELSLLKGFTKFWVSLSCQGAEQTLTSNIIAPL